jgi:sensor histidine kinase YesM
MSSPLDLTGKSNDDGVGQGGSPPTRKHDKPRRGKRHAQETRTQDEQEVIPTQHTLANSIGNMLFMAIFNVIMLFFGALFRAVSLAFGGSTFRSLGNFFGVDDSPLLNELPAEQEQQRQELAYIHENQVKQRQQLDDLRERVQRIEQRRKERELASKGHEAK